MFSFRSIGMCVGMIALLAVGTWHAFRPAGPTSVEARERTDFGGRAPVARPMEKVTLARVNRPETIPVRTAARAGAEAATIAARELHLLRTQRALSDWARNDPRGAADLAVSLPEGADRAALLAAVLTAWTEKDVAAASAWLEAVPAHPDFDGAFCAVAAHPALLEHRPEISLTWAEAVTSPTRRWQMIREVVQQWGGRDQEAARAWVEASKLSADQRAHLVARIASRTVLLD